MNQSDKDRRALEDARETLEKLNLELQESEMGVMQAKRAIADASDDLQSLIEKAMSLGQKDDAGRIVLARAIINYVRLLL